MRSISSRRRSSSSSSIRVCVGSPGTFSTRKCVSATLAICGRCVIVSTWARSARRCSVDATACAVTPPMPASISSNTSVSPPATAASARAMRESSPPDAVSAIGANGSPAFGRMRNVDLVGARRPDLALAELDEELALPHAERRELVRNCLAERPGARCARRRVARRRGPSCAPPPAPTARLAASTGSPPSAEAPSSRSAPRPASRSSS